ncbi:iron-hydroxamate ABC transporter substrate-binding protein [Caenibacillus caldisaponilyticus]|uniref:iron-hydroxamate ABC transporter substrate-binding protein n=1 Tax=Caenibacillus caldisaponilyticus TaxID=1674942 RepID=UPI00098840D7|nr:iron-hydroxamate ABC transporter substrate-binding protein [Caenibacillus caldisaponilyticus]
MLKRPYLKFSLIALLILILTACGAKSSSAPDHTAGGDSTAKQEKKADADETRTIHYLGKDYKVPAKVKRIVIAGSMETMEDALVLGVKPLGGITVGGKFPDMFKEITGSTVSIGEKAQPNIESILKLKPDVIFATTKFPPAVISKLEKVAPTIPVSHIATNWEANLRLLAELTGKQDLAEKVLQEYQRDVAAAKAKLGERLKDKKVVAVRIRNGNIMIYSKDIFFNPTLYTDLGLKAPQEIENAKAQEVISLEKFSEMNPDYIFVQFSEDENKDQPHALENWQNDPIWKSIRAVKNGKVFVNVVDPLAQGGTAWSKIHFLKAAVEKLGDE